MNSLLEEVFLEEPGACPESCDQNQPPVEVGTHSRSPTTPQSAAHGGAHEKGNHVWPMSQAAKNINDV